jgi:hypothetical protein
MAIDRWERRSGLWVRRRDDGDWDYFPSLVENASGYRLKEAFFDRLEHSEFIGRALAFGLGAPIMICALVFLATRPDWSFLAEGRSRGFAFLLGIVIVAGASASRWYARRAALLRAATSDTVLSADELRDVAYHMDVDVQNLARPSLPPGARKALAFAVGVMAVLAVVVFLIAFAWGLEVTMLVSGIVATLCLLVAIRLWHLNREGA